jgi:cobalt/nickel transport protein
MLRIIWMSLIGLSMAVSSGYAHFPMLKHTSPFAAFAKPVTVIFAVGHPFEQEYEDAKKPELVMVIDPIGKRVDVTESLQPERFATRGETKQRWNFEYTPMIKGDTIIRLDSHAEVDLDGGTVYQEYIKTWVHAERQRGWDQRTGQPLEIVPLTRPYGLVEGAVFSGRLMKGDAPVSDTEIYLERFVEQELAAEEYPPEALITFSVKTDKDGYFAYTLNEPGWWVIGGYADGVGNKEISGKVLTLDAFAGIWLHVEKKK